MKLECEVINIMIDFESYYKGKCKTGCYFAVPLRNEG